VARLAVIVAVRMRVANRVCFMAGLPDLECVGFDPGGRLSQR
jgi:hypothetical protein